MTVPTATQDSRDSFIVCFRKVKELDKDGKITVTTAWMVELPEAPCRISFCQYPSTHYVPFFNVKHVDLILNM